MLAATDVALPRVLHIVVVTLLSPRSFGSSSKRFLNNHGQTHAAGERRGAGQVIRPSFAIGQRQSAASCASWNRSSLLRASCRSPEPCSLPLAALSLWSLRLRRRGERTKQVRRPASAAHT